MKGSAKPAEPELLEKEKFYSSLSGKGITDDEYAHMQQVWWLQMC